jgi:hypothetical protein
MNNDAKEISANVSVKNIPFYVLGLLFFTIPFGTNLMSKVIILLVIVSLFLLPKHSWSNRFLYCKEYLVPSICIFVLFVLGTFWSENIPEALKKIEQALSFLVFPLLLPLFNFSKKDIILLFKIFVFTCLFILIMSFVRFIYISIAHDEYIILGETHLGDRPGNVYEFLSNNFLVVQVHRTYFSAYLLVCILFIMTYFSEFNAVLGKKTKWFGVLAIILLSLGIICLQSKANYAIYIILIIYYTIKKLRKSPNLFFKMVLVFVAILFFSKNIIINRLKPMVDEIENIMSPKNEDEKKFTKVLRPGSTETRYMLYKSSLQLIKQSPFLGYGTGDVRDVVREQNYINNYKSIAHLNYDPHSQILYMLIALGIVGFLAFTSLFLFPFISSITIKDSFTSLILLVLFLNCITESFFLRQEGLIPSVLFLTVLSHMKHDTKNNLH